MRAEATAREKRDAAAQDLSVMSMGAPRYAANSFVSIRNRHVSIENRHFSVGSHHLSIGKRLRTKYTREVHHSLIFRDTSERLLVITDRCER